MTTLFERQVPTERRPRLSRRHFLRVATAGGGVMLLAACGAPAAPAKPTESAKPAEPTKPAAAAPAPAAPAAPAPQPAASPAAPAAAAGAAQTAPTPLPTTAAASLKAPADKRNLVVVQGQDIAVLDPHMNTSTNNITVTFNIFDNLTTRDPDLNLIPQLATEWKTLNDTTWEFKLRPGVKFHNGDPLTSADVKFNHDRIQDPAAGVTLRIVFETVDHVEAPDDLTVRFITKKPDPLLPARLSFFGGQIIPEKYFKAVGPEEFNRKPIGSGPVKFKEWVKDNYLALDANKEYWGGAPDFDSVTFKPIPEPSARLASLLTGDADIITKVPSDQVQRVDSSGKARVEKALLTGLYVFALNSHNPPLDNPKVKQALSYAIDRETIIKSLFRGQGIVPNGMISKGDFAYEPNRPPLAYDPNKAKALLQEGGYKNEPVIIEVTQGQLQNDRETCEAVIDMWRKVGVNGQMEIIEAAVRAQKSRDKSYKGMYMSDPISTLQDPDGMAWRLLGPGAGQDYWRDPEFDRLGVEARYSLDSKLREADYHKMQDIFLQNFPWIPLLQPVELYGVQNYLSWRPNPNQLFQLRKEVLKFNR